MDNISYSKHVSAAEQKLLAAILSGAFSVSDFEDADLDLFSDTRHKAIFKSILSSDKNDSQGIDSVLLFEMAISKGLDHKVGGMDYINELMALSTSPDSVNEYLAIVVEAATKRKLSALINDVRLEIDNPKSKVAQICNRLITEVDEINNLYELKPETRLDKQTDIVISEILHKIMDDSEYPGLLFGFSALDALTGGVAPGELVVIAARPGMGKSAFVLNILLHLGTIQKKGAAYLTLEMNASTVIKRILANLSGIQFHHIHKANLTEDEAKTLLLCTEILNETKTYVIDKPPTSVFEIAQMINRLVHKQNVELLIIDYIQLLSIYGNNNYVNREQEISKICSLLKKLAIKHNVAIVLVSQLSRATETRGGARRPILSDLKDSGAIEQEADKVLFLYRPEYYGILANEDNESTKGVAEVIVAKNRNGPIGTAKLRFKDRTASFADFEPLEDSFEDYIERSKAEKNIKIDNKIFKPINSKTENEEDVPW
jgi:replicative DNA helicase